MHNQLTEDEKDVLSDFFPSGLVALDLETTGLNPFTDQIIEIGAIKIYMGKETSFQSLVRPSIKIPPEINQLCRINDEMIKDAPSIFTLLPSFMNFLGDLPIVAHNARYDVGFLSRAICNDDLQDFPDGAVYDSCALSRRVLKGGPSSFSLNVLCTHFGIELPDHHRAMGDAWACLKIFSRCLMSIRDRMQPHVLQKNGLLFNLADFQRNRYVTHDGPLLKEINQGIQSKKHLEILYAGGRHPNSYRPIRPIGIIPLPRGMVVHACCLIENKNKSFLLQKIQNVRSIETRML